MKIMRLVRIVPLFLLTLLLCVGCGPKKPEGIPKLFPTKIKVVKGGSPVTKANVILFAVEGSASGSWSVQGETDATGVAVIETSQGQWKSPGAPEGDYKFCITKLGKIEEPEMPENMDGDEEAKNAYYAERLKRLEEASKEIPKSLTTTDAGLLTVTVASGSGADVTVDVADYE